MPKPLREWIYELLPGGRAPRGVTFRVDAGKVDGLSFGHLERCLIMGRILRDIGSECRYVMRSIPGGPERAESSGYEVVRLDAELSPSAEWEVLERLVLDSDSSCLVVDLPYHDMDFPRISRINREVSPVLYLDDARFEMPDVHAYLNSSILASEMLGNNGKNRTRLFLGPQWLILDEGFWKHNKSAVINDGSIVLTFGGSDPTGLLPKVMRELSSENLNGTRIKCILGPGYGETPSGMTGSNKKVFDIIRSPRDLIAILANCRAAVCAGGRTMYELWALDKPFLPIGTAEHEARAIAAFKSLSLSHLGMGAWNKIEFRAQFKVLQKLSALNRD